jgi:TP901 family phage tail tape measure protein
MTDMRVKMVLDLVNRTTAGAKAAARDLKGVKDAANALNGAKGGAAIAADMNRVSPAGRKAASSLREVRTAERSLGQSGGADRLQAKLDRARSSAAKLRAELARSTALSDLNTAQGKGGGAGAGAAMLAAGRSALMPLAAAYGGYRATGAGVRGTVGQSVSREKAMADVRKKVDLPEGETFERLERTITKFSIAFGQSFENVAAIVAEAGAAGVAFEQLAGFTELATKASIAWDVPAREAAQKLFEIRAATQSTLPQLEEFADMINALGDSSAAKESSILEMFQRVGAAAKEAGVPIKTSLAFLTGIRSVGIGDEVGARAFGALTNKLVTADRSKKGTKALKEMGLNAKAFAARMKTDATGALLSFFEALEKTPDAIGPLTDFVGNEWFDEVLRMKGAVTEIRKALALLSDPANYKGSTTKTLNIELQTTANHLERLKAQASDVGDRLGRWALPAINEGIAKIIAGMDEFDKRAEQRRQAEVVSSKLAEGKPLTAEERQRMVKDRELAKRLGRQGDRQADDISRNSDILGKGVSAGDREKLQWRRDRLMAEEKALQSQIDAVAARKGPGMAQAIVELERKQIDSRRKRDEIDRALQRGQAAGFDPRRPADQGERGRPDRAEVMALKERIAQQESRLAALDELIKLSSNPADKAGFRSDRAPDLLRRAQAEGEFRRRVAPTLAAAGNFGFGPGGAPATSRPQGAGPGRLSFGLNGATSPGAAWAEKIKGDFDIDLGPAGMTMMERLTAGVRAGGSGAQGAADGVRSGITGAFDGADLSGAGSAMMASLATGIRAGGAQAVAAAREVAAQAKAAAASGISGGGRRPLSGALHDGVE